MKFKDKIMLHIFREVRCRWEAGEVGRWERSKGNEVARWEKRESGEVGMVGGSWFYSRLGNIG